MRTALLGLVTVMACSDSHAPLDVADASGGAVQADAAPAPLVDATYGAAEAGAGAARDLCGQAVQRFGYVEYTLTLPDFCEMLAKDGRGACPANRRAAVEASIDCSKPGAFPVLSRSCGTDKLFMSHPTLYYVGWTFDPVTGDLIAARVSGTELACGRGTYLAGPQETRCDASLPECHLCEGGAQRDADCPADVVAALPSKSCTAPAAAPGCTCENPSGSFQDLPPPGAACGAPTTCPRCQAGTCWANCVCAIDGVPRWKLECTE